MFPSRRQARVLSRGLGWFSIGLGVLELVAARRLSRVATPGDSERLVRAYGLREIATGAGLLAGSNPAPWMWARVAGDALDLATIGASLNGRRRTGTVVALAAVAGVAALDLACARSLSREAPQPSVDYSGRSGWPRAVDEMRGAARQDFQPPTDLRTPALLRSWQEETSQALP